MDLNRRHRSELIARRVMLLIVLAPLVLAAAMVFISSMATLH